MSDSILLLALALGVALVQAGSLVSYADTFFEDGDFRFAVTSGDRLLVAKYNGSGVDVALPASVGDRAVTGVYKNCFENTAVESVSLPEGYTSIGAFAFSGCESLAAVTLPTTLESIGIMAFSGCTSLQQVDFAAAESLSSIAFAAFNGCAALEEAILPDSLTSLGENAFCNCSSLETLHVPAQITVLPEYAFYGCPLTALALPASVATIGESCFENNALAQVYVPDTVTTIGANAFAPANSILCFEGSAAAAYCRESGVENAQIVEKIFGDADTNGYINVNDVTAIQRCLAELDSFNAVQAVLADTNGDGVISVDDATRLQMYLAEYDVTLGSMV